MPTVIFQGTPQLNRIGPVPLLWLVQSVYLEVASQPPLVSFASSPLKACSLCKMRVSEFEPAPSCPLSSHLVLCFAVVIFKVVREGRTVSAFPLEHMLKTENKMHCDILAKDLSLALGKASWMSTHCHTVGRKPRSPNVTSELVCCYIFSVHLIILPFHF